MDKQQFINEVITIYETLLLYPASGRKDRLREVVEKLLEGKVIMPVDPAVIRKSLASCSDGDTAIFER